MSHLEFTFPEDLTQLLEAFDSDGTCEKVLEAATPIVEKNMKSRAARHRKTGSMAQSIKASKPKKNQYGYYSVVRPTGKDKDGVRNMEKAAYLEYGAIHHGQSATPFIAPAVAESRDSVYEIEQKTLEEIAGLH